MAAVLMSELPEVNRHNVVWDCTPPVRLPEPKQKSVSVPRLRRSRFRTRSPASSPYPAPDDAGVGLQTSDAQLIL